MKHLQQVLGRLWKVLEVLWKVLKANLSFGRV